MLEINTPIAKYSRDRGCTSYTYEDKEFRFLKSPHNYERELWLKIGIYQKKFKADDRNTELQPLKDVPNYSISVSLKENWIKPEYYESPAKLTYEVGFLSKLISVNTEIYPDEGNDSRTNDCRVKMIEFLNDLEDFYFFKLRKEIMTAGTHAQNCIIQMLPEDKRQDHKAITRILMQYNLLVDRGYKYGTAWLHEPLPFEDVMTMAEIMYKCPMLSGVKENPRSKNMTERIKNHYALKEFIDSGGKKVNVRA